MRLPILKDWQRDYYQGLFYRLIAIGLPMTAADDRVYDAIGPRPYALDEAGRRWLLDGSGDVA